MESPAPRRARSAAVISGARTGRVVRVEEGVVVVQVRGQLLRTTYDGALLALVAREPSEAPRPGDRVRLRDWADDRTTVDRVIARPLGR